VASKKGALRAYRKANGLTAAEAAGRLGVAASTLRSWENGTRELSAEMAVKAEHIFGINRVNLRPDLFRRREAA
jgi:transcriptional regulator with XRE-family HTH domain